MSGYERSVAILQELRSVHLIEDETSLKVTNCLHVGKKKERLFLCFTTASLKKKNEMGETLIYLYI